MEGIATETEIQRHTKAENEIKTVLYSGTLHKRFGVLNLVHAFGLIENPSYKLVICGIGDSEKEIKDVAAKDPRIDFRGQLDRKDILKLQQEATVLVNPRQNNEEFTKYSFPSKNLEYLSSGTPLVAYKLDGIPDEYDDFINYVPDNSPETLANKLIEVCEQSPQKRRSHGEAARKFVLENKNAVVQTKKILDLLENRL